MQSFIYKLLNYLNGSIKQDTNYHIARTLLYHIKEIEIMSNPVNNRYYLAIITQHSIAAFGTKMPLEDLRWVKKFLIHEILR